MSATDDHTLTWLHLSDIHFGHGTTEYGIDQELVVRRLLEDAVATVKAGAVPHPDVIIVTGDIGNTGAGRDDSEYAKAREFLLELSDRVAVPTDRILLVPGNHDANRGIETRSRFAQRLLDALRHGGCPVDEAIANGEEAAILASRFQGYRSLADSFGGPAASADTTTQFWEHTIDLGGGITVRVVSFNTALLAAGDDDDGKLQLGMAQVRDAFAVRADPGRITLALSHHPFEWLGSDKSVDAYLRHDGGIHLSGHLHVQRAAQHTIAGEKTLNRITAGAVHRDEGDDSDGEQHGYNFAQLRVIEGSAQVTFWPRVFNGAAFERHAALTGGADSYTFPPLNPKPLIPQTPPSAEEPARLVRSRELLADVGERRTAYPTDMSIAQLSDLNLLLDPRLVTRDTHASLGLAELVDRIASGESVLVVGDPGVGKTVLTYLVHHELLDRGITALPAMITDLVGQEADVAAVAATLELDAKDLAGDQAPVLIVDGIDEALAGGATADQIAAALRGLARLGPLLVTCRVREFEADLQALLGEFSVIGDVQPWTTEDFEDYVRRLAAAGRLRDAAATLSWVHSDQALVELARKPLLARMLTYLAEEQGSAPTDVTMLYTIYLKLLALATERRLARVGCVERPDTTFGLWTSFAWYIFRTDGLTGDTMEGDHVVSFFARRADLECAYERASGILDWVRSRGVVRARFRHYTFFEYLLADHIESELHRRSLNDSGSCTDLFEADLPREVRRHLTRLMPHNDERLTAMFVRDFEALSTVEDRARRRLVGNLLAYFLGRVDVHPEAIRTLLAAQDDPFLRNSLRWTLSNLDDLDAVRDFMAEIGDGTTDAAKWNRGYLRYYYGDQPREHAVPPYVDDDPAAEWSQTRTKTMEMILRAGYTQSETGARRALDLYTLVDFFRFHGSALGEDERHAIETGIETLPGEAADIAEATRAILDGLG